MSSWWWLLWIALAGIIWGFVTGFCRAMGYDVGIWFLRKREGGQ